MDSTGTDQQTPPLSRARIVFWSLWVVALLLKLQFATVLGTVDIVLYLKYGLALARSGVEQAYASDPSYNIPPLAAAYSALLVTLTKTTSLVGPSKYAFAFFLKLPGILAETAFAVVLLAAVRWGEWVAPLDCLAGRF